MDLEHIKCDLLHLAIQIYLLSLKTQKACQSFTLKHDIFWFCEFSHHLLIALSQHFNCFLGQLVYEFIQYILNLDSLFTV